MIKEIRHDLRTSRRLAAYHEAGHAVASFFRPRAGATTWMTIRPADLGEGDAGAHYSEWQPGRHAVPPDHETLRALAVVALAGPEVDRRLTGNEFTSGDADYQAVRELLFRGYFDPEIDALVSALPPDEAQRRGLDAIADQAAAEIEDELKHLVDQLREEARQIIETRWPEVEAVAEALLQSGALGGAEVRRILEAVGQFPGTSDDPSR